MANLFFQLALTRHLAEMIWYHFAFLVISLAFLGFGGAGLYRFRRASQPISGSIPPAWPAFLFSLSLLLVLALLAYLPLDPATLAWDRNQWVYLFAAVLLLAIPFFFSGLFLSSVYSQPHLTLGFLVASDLCGAATGSLLFLLIASAVDGPRLLWIAPLFPAIAAALLSGKGRKLFLFAPWAALIAAGFLFKPVILGFPMSPFKPLKVALSYPESRHYWARWNPSSRLDLIKSPMARFAPGLSLEFRGSLPPQTGLTVDGEALTALTHQSADSRMTAFYPYLPAALPFELHPPARVLLLDPKGGVELGTALFYRAKEIFLVEPNPGIVEAYVWHDKAITPTLVKTNKVHITREQIRRYLARTPQTFDHIVFPLPSALAGGGGLMGMTEDYLFTVEGMQSALKALSKEGSLSVTRYLTAPPREELRLGVLALKALAGFNLDLRDRLVAFRSWGTFTLLLKKSPFTPLDISRMRNFFESRRFDPIYFPGIAPYEANRYNRFPYPLYYQAYREILTPEKQDAYLAAYPFDLSPAWDDRPFFYHFFKLKTLPLLWDTVAGKWPYFLEGGYLIYPVLALALFWIALFSLLAAVWMRRIPRTEQAIPAGRIYLYFGLLGTGYLLMEITLFKGAMLWLGQAPYALALTLTTLLLGSGIGGWLAPRTLNWAGGSIRILFSAIIAGILALGLGWPYLAGGFLKAGFYGQVAGNFLVFSGVGFLIGLPFPLGLSPVRAESLRLAPFAWMVNALYGVLGATLAAALGLSLGLRITLILAGLIYLAAMLVFPRPESARP
jgi:hypothetical protein